MSWNPGPFEVPEPGLPDDDWFVGREVELLGAHEAAASARRGPAQLLLVGGEAGVGKSAFLEQVRLGLIRAGWLTAAGRCPEAGSAPPAGPWAHALRSLARDAADVLDPVLAAALAPLLSDDPVEHLDVARERLHLHRAVAEFLVRLRRPLVLVLDDLHRADAETLGILRSVSDLLVHEHGVVEVLLAGAFRTGEVNEQLDELLAALARHSPARLRLAGLDDEDAATLVHKVCGRPVDDATLQALVRRSGGNPLYLEQSALLLGADSGSGLALQAHADVSDVLRRRVAQVPDAEAELLALAALIGRDLDADVLADASGAGADAVLAAIQTGLATRLLIRGDGGIRFAHVLIQETLLRDLPPLQRIRWHEAAARALDRLRPKGFAALAYHYGKAQSPVVAARAIAASVLAARIAVSRFAYDTAATCCQQALTSAEMLPADHPEAGDETRASLYAQLVSVLLWSGHPLTAADALSSGLALAERSGRDDLCIQILRSADVPLLWPVPVFSPLDLRKVALLQRLLSGDLDPVTRCQLLCVLVRELGPDDAGAARPAALEAVEIARSIGDPSRLCSALGVLAGVVLSEAEPQVKRRIAEELLELGVRDELPAGLVLGHHNLLQVAGALADLPLMRRHLELEWAQAQRYGLAQSLDSGRLARAAIDHVTGRLADAERGYLRAVASIRRHRTLDAEAVGALAVFTLRHTAGREAELAGTLRQLVEVIGPVAADVLALALSAAGEQDAAVAAYRAGAWPRRNGLHVMLATVRGAAAVVAGAVDDAPGIIERLHPFAGQIAGLGTGTFAVGPVAQVLGDLSIMLGRPDEARVYFRQASEVCLRAGAPLWGASALAALRGLERPA